MSTCDVSVHCGESWLPITASRGLVVRLPRWPVPPGMVGPRETWFLVCSHGSESFALCCSSLNRSLGEAVQTAELFHHLCGSVSGILRFLYYDLNIFSLVLESVVMYKVYWEACAEHFTMCVGLLGINAVVFGVEDQFPSSGMLWRSRMA